MARVVSTSLICCLTKHRRKRGDSWGSQAVAQRCLTIVGKYGISGWLGTDTDAVLYTSPKAIPVRLGV